MQIQLEVIQGVWESVRSLIKEAKRLNYYDEIALAEWLRKHGVSDCVNNQGKVLLDFDNVGLPIELCRPDDSVKNGTVLSTLQFALILSLPNAWTEEVL